MLANVETGALVTTTKTSQGKVLFISKWKDFDDISELFPKNVSVNVTQNVFNRMWTEWQLKTTQTCNAVITIYNWLQITTSTF